MKAHPEPPTERSSASPLTLDRLSVATLVRHLLRSGEEAVRATRWASRQLTAAACILAETFKSGGRIFFVGAGTSGRICAQEAAECWPTFGVPRTRIDSIVAGGRKMLWRAVEGAEDDAAAAGREVIRRRIGRGDCVVGVSASGTTRFVLSALHTARKRGAATVFITSNPAAAAQQDRLWGGLTPRRERVDKSEKCTRRNCSPSCVEPTAGINLKAPARAASTPGLSHRVPLSTVTVVLPTGPELLTGSTRLKAGTAAKLALNTITTAAMCLAGRAFGNLMVNLQPMSRKLRERAIRIVMQVCSLTRPKASRLLKIAGGDAAVAVLAHSRQLDVRQAKRLLAASHGSLREAMRRSRK